MQRVKFWSCTTLALSAALLIVGSLATNVAAETSTNSSNYQVREMQFGAGSTLESCSGDYCARASIGDLAAGDAKNTKSTASFGTAVSTDPVLEVIVDRGQSNLGYMTTEETSSKTSVLRVRNYLSDGYVIQIIGDVPKYNGHSLAAPTEPTASTPGKEQFGINVVANTTPNLGADPLQVPSGEMSFGRAAAGYDQPNKFKFSSGDVIAYSETESGRTDYTISMIVNVSNTTPAGHYTGDYSAVVIPVY